MSVASDETLVMHFLWQGDSGWPGMSGLKGDKGSNGREGNEVKFIKSTGFYSLKNCV